MKTDYNGYAQVNVLISIIVPVYNAENYIDRCLISLMNQDYRHIEIIIVNDGSTDSSASIITEISKHDNRVRLVNEQNHGATFARKKGVEHSKGEWVYFVDADDFIEPDTLSSMVKEIDDNVDLIVYESNLDGETSRESYYEQLFHSKLLAVWGKLYRRSLLDEYILSVPQYFKVGEDFLFQLRLMNNISRKIICRRDKKYNYTVNNPNSIQKSHVQSYDYEKRMIEEVQKTVEHRLPSAISFFVFDWKIKYLGGMMGLRYNIKYQDGWIQSLKEEKNTINLQ